MEICLFLSGVQMSRQLLQAKPIAVHNAFQCRQSCMDVFSLREL